MSDILYNDENQEEFDALFDDRINSRQYGRSVYIPSKLIFLKF